MISTITLIVAILSSTVTAFPTVGGYCDAGIAGVGQGSHVNVARLTTGALSDAGFQLSIGGRQVYQNSVFEFQAGAYHSITLTATSDIMRGVLLRLESTDGSRTIGAITTSDPNAEENNFCEAKSVSGISHVSNTPKTSITGTIYMPTAAELVLDATAVVSTIVSYGQAEWYYSQFKLRAVAPGSTISYTGAVPTAPPTVAPCTVQLGGYCRSDGACCTGRCIRSDSQAIWAPGYCTAASGTTTTTTTTTIQQAPPSTTFTLGAKGASCNDNSDCESSRCKLDGSSGVCASTYDSTETSLSGGRGGGGGPGN